MRTWPSISVGFGSGLSASSCKAFVFPSVDVQSWTFKCDEAMERAFCKRSGPMWVSVLFSCMPLAFCPGLFSFDNICRALLFAGCCPCPGILHYLLWCWYGRRCYAFPFLLSDPVAVCAQTRQGALPESWHPALPAKEGSKTCRVGMTFTCASDCAAGLARQRRCALLCAGCREPRLQTELFVKTTQFKCYPSCRG